MRGQISFNTIIVLVIALMVLLLVGTFFSGGFGDLSSKLMIFGRESTGDSTQTGQMVACNSACTGWIAGGCPEPPRIQFNITRDKCGLPITASKADLETECGKCP